MSEFEKIYANIKESDMNLYEEKQRKSETPYVYVKEFRVHHKNQITVYVNTKVSHKVKQGDRLRLVNIPKDKHTSTFLNGKEGIDNLYVYLINNYLTVNSVSGDTITCILDIPFPIDNDNWNNDGLVEIDAEFITFSVYTPQTNQLKVKRIK